MQTPSHFQETQQLNPSDLVVSYNSTSIELNPTLVARQQLSQDRIDRIKTLHEMKLRAIKLMSDSDDPAFLRTLGDTVTNLEFLLQDAWGFGRNQIFHAFWTLPKCECPKYDNWERYGAAPGIINCSCPVHGDINDESRSPVQDLR